MNRIDELIAELCPEGIHHASLNSVAELKRGTSITKKRATEGNIPVVAGGRTAAYFHGVSNRVGETIVVAGSGAYAGYVSWWEGPIFVSDAFSVKPDKGILIPRYCFHWLLFKQEVLHNLKSGGGVPHVYAKDVGKLRIPIPPLEVQRVIVDILDKFVKLEAELEAELEARKRQYEYYRRELLTFGEDVEWSSLGKVSLKVSSGGTPTKRVKRYYQDGSIPWLRTQEVFFSEVWKTEEFITEDAVAETSAKWIPKNCLIVAISGASAGRSAINKISLTTNQHCCNLQIDPDRMSYKFAFHWVSSNYQELKSLGRGARSDLNARIIQDFPIPVPPLPDQHRIVELLDKFDALVNDLSSGLPAEIAARRKQYEYYRDKLLTFKELAS